LIIDIPVRIGCNAARARGGRVCAVEVELTPGGEPDVRPTTNDVLTRAEKAAAAVAVPQS